ncbi:MAG: hypothetical protein JW849_11490 [Phycisphaerae bacterium]|nr:hypothetical protein [Phycisphaerae bacterium]
MCSRVFFLLLFTLGVAGCEWHTSLAMVVRTDEMSMQVQNIAPTIPLRRPDGKLTTLHDAAAPFYLVAFVEVRGDAPNYISPDVEKIARDFWLESVSVAQITIPAAGSSFPGDVLARCAPPKDNLILVLDPKKLAWEMFHKPAPGTLLLIDKHGYITSVGSLANSKNVRFDTYQMAKEWDQKQWERSFSIDYD